VGCFLDLVVSYYCSAHRWRMHSVCGGVVICSYSVLGLAVSPINNLIGTERVSASSFHNVSGYMTTAHTTSKFFRPLFMSRAIRVELISQVRTRSCNVDPGLPSRRLDMQTRQSPCEAKCAKQDVLNKIIGCKHHKDKHANA
jgi:hypothetical protein